MSLPVASTAGNLLVAVLAANTAAVFSGPAGWSRGPAVSTTGSRSGHTEIWYLSANAGGVSSATFTAAGATQVEGQLSEWAGAAVSPLEASGTSAPSSSASSDSVSTTSPPPSAGDLGITAFDLATSRAQGVKFTPGTGWTNLGSNGASATNNSFTSDYLLGLPLTAATETESSDRSGNWAGAIAAFKSSGACTGGSLTLTAPGAVSFPSLTLNGRDQTTSTSLALNPDDETGSGSGWKLTATSTLFTNAAGDSLPAGATTITGASTSVAAGECSLPTDTVRYPVTLPAGATTPPAATIFDAAAGSGAGAAAVNLNVQLRTPANSYSGSYSSTWTFTVASGP